jgi:hypothetical protein
MSKRQLRREKKRAKAEAALLDQEDIAFLVRTTAAPYQDVVDEAEALIAKARHLSSTVFRTNVAVRRELQSTIEALDEPMENLKERIDQYSNEKGYKNQKVDAKGRHIHPLMPVILRSAYKRNLDAYAASVRYVMRLEWSKYCEDDALKDVCRRLYPKKRKRRRLEKGGKDVSKRRRARLLGLGAMFNNVRISEHPRLAPTPSVWSQRV